MTSINADNLQTLVNLIRDSTKEALNPEATPAISQMLEETEEMAAKLKDATQKVNMQHLGIEKDNYDLLGSLMVQPRRGSKEPAKTDVDVQNTVINWLVQICETVVVKLNDHSTILAALVAKHDNEIKEVKEEVKKEKEQSDEIKKEFVKLEKDNDDIRQRSMKGNLIVSSPRKEGTPTLLLQQPWYDEERGFGGKETDTDMVRRIVAEKTGVWFHPDEIQACHTLNRDRTSFILRISNLKPLSNWDILQTGMLNGRNPESGKNFTRSNVFLSHQLTKQRLVFLQEVVKVAKVAKQISSYCTDQNGTVRVSTEVGQGKKWKPVSNKEELEVIIRRQ